MKPTRFVILFVLMFVYFAVQSQKPEYKPIPFPLSEGAIWSQYTHSGMLPLANGYSRYILSEDTIVGDTTFIGVYEMYKDRCEKDDKSILRGWLGEKEQRIYFKENRADFSEVYPTRLLYDFTLERGDSVLVQGILGEMGYQKVVKVDTLFIGSKLRKRIYFRLNEWIEGVGSTKGLLTGFIMDETGVSVDLNCVVTADGEYIYGPRWDNDECFSTGLHRFESLMPDYELRTYSGGIEIVFKGNGYEILSLINMDGRVLDRILISNKECFVIPTTGYAKGLYLLLLERGDKRSVSKVEI